MSDDGAALAAVVAMDIVGAPANALNAVPAASIYGLLVGQFTFWSLLLMLRRKIVSVPLFVNVTTRVLLSSVSTDENTGLSTRRAVSSTVLTSWYGSPFSNPNAAQCRRKIWCSKLVGHGALLCGVYFLRVPFVSPSTASTASGGALLTDANAANTFCCCVAAAACMSSSAVVSCRSISSRNFCSRHMSRRACIVSRIAVASIGEMRPRRCFYAAKQKPCRNRRVCAVACLLASKCSSSIRA